VLFRLLCATCLVSPQDVKVFFREKSGTEEVLHELGEDDGEDHDQEEDKPKRKPRSKALCIVTILGLIFVKRSRNANAIQTLLGYYLYPACTGRRAINVLNHLGVTLPYGSILNSLEHIAHKAVQSICNCSRAGLPMLITYDNLNWYQKVRNETLLNKPMELLWIAGAMINLRMTPPLAMRLGNIGRKPSGRRA
jgi:hypothetical protein